MSGERGLTPEQMGIPRGSVETENRGHQTFDTSEGYQMPEGGANMSKGDSAKTSERPDGLAGHRVEGAPQSE